MTGLPGRALFLDRIEQVLAIAPHEERLLALLIMKLNRIGSVNKVLGNRRRPLAARGRGTAARGGPRI